MAGAAPAEKRVRFPRLHARWDRAMTVNDKIIKTKFEGRALVKTRTGDTALTITEDSGDHQPLRVTHRRFTRRYTVEATEDRAEAPVELIGVLRRGTVVDVQVPLRRIKLLESTQANVPDLREHALATGGAVLEVGSDVPVVDSKDGARVRVNGNITKVGYAMSGTVIAHGAEAIKAESFDPKAMAKAIIGDGGITLLVLDGNTDVITTGIVDNLAGGWQNNHLTARRVLDKQYYFGDGLDLTETEPLPANE